MGTAGRGDAMKPLDLHGALYLAADMLAATARAEAGGKPGGASDLDVIR